MEQQAEHQTSRVQQPRHLGVIPQDGFMRYEDVVSVLCESRTGLYRRILRGEYPQPVKLPGGRTSVWAASDIRELVELIKQGKTWADREVSAAE